MHNARALTHTRAQTHPGTLDVIFVHALDVMFELASFMRQNVLTAVLARVVFLVEIGV